MTSIIRKISLIIFCMIAFGGNINMPAQAQSCWSVMVYDEGGKLISNGECAQNPAEDFDRSQPPTKDQAEKNKGKTIEKGQLIMLDPPGGAATKLSQMGFSISEKIIMRTLNTEVWVLEIPPGSDIVKSLLDVRLEFPGVIIDTNDLMNLSAGSSTDYSRQTVGWGNVPLTCGAGLKIGMIDGGVDVNHEALKGQKIIYKSFIKEDRTAVAFDHGTAVASILVGKPISDKISGGLLPGAELYAGGIFEQRKGKEVGNLASLFRAIEWMAFEDVPVVNLSIAGGMNKVMEMVIARANTTGIIMVAAAGNNGPYADPAWPAAHESVIAVTAIDRKNKIYAWANQGDYIDFSAPGVDLPVFTTEGPKIESGTSFASPFITAVVGLHLLAGFPNDIKKIKASMQKHANDLSGNGRDKTFGYGLVRIKASCK